MTQQEILDHFGYATSDIYIFGGPVKDLVEYCESNGLGYNYLVTNYTVYFIVITGQIVADPRVSKLNITPAEIPADTGPLA